MKISIAMCTYNGREFIAEQLDSLARQTSQPLELIICDDGSTDNTIELIDNFRTHAPFPVHLYRNEENLGFTGNFFKAASLCRGEGIAFCDQDDIWETHKLEICSSALETEHSDLVIHEGRVINSAGVRSVLRIPDLSTGAKSFQVVPYEIAKGFAMMARRAVIAGLMENWNWNDYLSFKRQFGAPMGHDVLVYAWCVGRRRISSVRQELVRYRVHGRNVTATADIVEPNLAQIGGFFAKINFAPSCYSAPGLKWRAEAAFLNGYLSRCSREKPRGLERLLAYLEQKASLWIRRAGMYEPKIGRLERLRTLALLLKLGAYFPGRRPTLGLRALAKDLVVALAL